MRLSLVLSGFGPIAATLPAVDAAERHGFDGVWSSEYLGFHDAIVPSTLYLSRTSRLEIGVMGLSTAGRHPGLSAMELMSLSELAPGRIRCQVGLGDAASAAKLGRQISAPLPSTEAFVRNLRSTLQGETMQAEHREFAFAGYNLAGLGPPPPLDVMAIRPGMVRLACRIGDGVSLSIGASFAYLKDVIADIERELAAADRPRDSFRITALAMASIGGDVDKACRPVAAINAGAHQATAAFLARGVVDAEELLGIEQAQGPAGLKAYWTPARVRQISLVSTPDGVGEKLSEYAALGIDELGLMIVNPAAELPELIAAIAEAHKTI